MAAIMHYMTQNVHRYFTTERRTNSQRLSIFLIQTPPLLTVGYLNGWSSSTETCTNIQSSSRKVQHVIPVVSVASVVFSRTVLLSMRQHLLSSRVSTVYPKQQSRCKICSRAIAKILRNTHSLFVNLFFCWITLHSFTPH